VGVGDFRAQAEQAIRSAMRRRFDTGKRHSRSASCMSFDAGCAAAALTAFLSRMPDHAPRAAGYAISMTPDGCTKRTIRRATDTFSVLGQLSL